VLLVSCDLNKDLYDDVPNVNHNQMSYLIQQL
jgi:hypothetical protein